MIQINHTIHAAAPVSHNEMSGDMGNITQFRRMRMLRDGQVYAIPAISAGALRGVVRRLLWREVFVATGLNREAYGPGWDRLYAALANGGTIESAETRVSPDEIRARRTALPLLSLLGSALYQGFIAGRLRLEHSWLACSESGFGEMSMHDQMQEVSTVRHVDRDEQDPAVSGVTPMPTTVEVVVAGAAFRGRGVIGGTSLEASAWAHGLDLVRGVGGKQGQGCGSAHIEHDGDGAEWVAWLAANAAQQRDALCELGEAIAPSKKKEKKKGKKEAEVEPVEAAE